MDLYLLVFKILRIVLASGSQMAGLYLSRSPRLLECKNWDADEPLFTCQCSVVHKTQYTHWLVGNCGRGLLNIGGICWRALREVPRCLSENANFARVEVGRGNTARLPPSPT